MDYRAKLVIKNTSYLYVRLFITLIIGFVTSRVILRVLGVEDFGIYSLVGGVVSLFVFVNQALSASTQRFITYELGKGEEGDLAGMFSMCINVHLLFGGLIWIALEIAGLLLLNGVLNISAGRMDAAHWVFQCMTVSSVVGVFRVPYTSLITADEKFGFIAVIGIIEPLLKLFILYILLIANMDKLILYSILFMCVTILSTLFCVVYCKKHYSREIRYQVNLRWTDMKSFLKFSGMSLYEQIAVVCSYQGVDFLLNVYHGVVVNAAMGITKQVQAGVFNFVSGFQSAMAPQITKSYASKDMVYLTKLMESIPKYSLFLILMLSLPIMFNMNDLLTLWLVEYPEYTDIFCHLILISCILESVSMPYRTLVYAEGKIAKYQLIVGSCFLLNLIFSFVFLALGFEPQVVLIIRIAVYLLIDAIRIMFYRRYCTMGFLRYLGKTFGGVFAFVVVAVPLLFLVNQVLGFNLICRMFASIGVMLPVVWLLGISSSERKTLSVAIKTKLHIC